MGHSCILSTIIYKCALAFHLELSSSWHNILITCPYTCRGHNDILRLDSFLVCSLLSFPCSLSDILFGPNHYSCAFRTKKVPWIKWCIDKLWIREQNSYPSSANYLFMLDKIYSLILLSMESFKEVQFLSYQQEDRTSWRI